MYAETLELDPDMVTEGGVMFRSGGTQLFIHPSRYKASGHTQMSWLVNDIKTEVAALKAKGVEFLDFDMPGITRSTASPRAGLASGQRGSVIRTATC